MSPAPDPPYARTTPAVYAEIVPSSAPCGLLAQRCGVSTEAIRKWRKRGAADCLDRSARPHSLPWKATAEARAVVCLLRESTHFALDDLTFVARHVLPHLNRGSIWRIFKAEGLNLRRPARDTGKFRDYDLGFIDIDIEQLLMLQTADFQRRKRCLFVAIDRFPRPVHLAVRDDMTTSNVVSFLREAAAELNRRLNETRHVSEHFGKRRGDGKRSGHRQRAWPKLTAVLHTHSHLIVGTVTGVGLNQDSPDFTPVMRQAASIMVSARCWPMPDTMPSTTTAFAARSWA